MRAFLWGVVVGGMYSVFGIRRAAFMKLHSPRWISSILLHIEDFLICVTGAGGLSILYFATTRGVLRIMAIPCLGLGSLLWRLSGGRLVTICTDAILDLLAKMVRWIFQTVFAPIGRGLKSICQRIGGAIANRSYRRYLRKLNRIAAKETLRYPKALTAACLIGQLPDFHGRGAQRRLQKKRIRKESFK